MRPPLSSAPDFRISEAQGLVMDGDSVTQGFQNGVGGNPAYAWWAPMLTAIQSLFTAASKTPPSLTSVAVGGRTSTQTLAAVATPIALNPAHLFLLSSVNDPVDGISAATSAANIAAYCRAVWAKVPGCRIHILSNLWGATEHWPDGANTEDAGVNAMNTAEKAAIAGFPLARWYDLRTPLLQPGGVESVQNPANAATGQLIQNGGGYHPTILPANPPSTTSGQKWISDSVYAALQFNLS